MKPSSQTSNFGTTARINHNSADYYDSKLYADLPQMSAPKIEPDKELPPELENTIILGDAQNMKEIPNNSIHLMITSPVYNVSKEYDHDLSLQEYL